MTLHAQQNYRQLSFLHLFHHSSILVVWGYLLQSGHANGTAYFGAAINSFVHTVMYAHYLYTATGRVNPFKAAVTQLQMGQFWLCLLHAGSVVLWERVLPSTLGYLQVGGHVWCVVMCGVARVGVCGDMWLCQRLTRAQLAYHVIMLLLFSDFQRRTYGDRRNVGKTE